MSGRIFAAFGILAALTVNAGAQTMVEHSSEARFQLDLKVPDAALMTHLPPGFTLNVATQGAAKDCNLRAVFIDRVTINAPDGKPVSASGWSTATSNRSAASGCPRR